jgi:hypothetical protein
MFRLDDAALRRMADSNGMDLGKASCVLFGLRGCLPLEELDLTPLESETFELAELDHFRPRCAIGIWDRDRKLVAATAGSTVPNRNAVAGSLKAARAGATESANQLMPSLIAFEKGAHMISNPDRSYMAFRQHGPFALQRSRDDLDYDLADPVMVGIVGDNLHAAFVESSKAATNQGCASNGCQVVVGFAKRKAGPAKDLGMWPRFRDLAYASGQDRWPYMLLSGSDAQKAATAAGGTVPLRLRYGSSGPQVRKLQSRLTRLGFLDSDEAGLFKANTLLAVCGFQNKNGLDPDGVAGINTAEALGMAEDWPRF